MIGKSHNGKSYFGGLCTDNACSAIENNTFVFPLGGNGTSNTKDDMYLSIGNNDVKCLLILNNLEHCLCNLNVCFKIHEILIKMANEII